LPAEEADDDFNRLVGPRFDRFCFVKICFESLRFADR